MATPYLIYCTPEGEIREDARLLLPEGHAPVVAEPRSLAQAGGDEGVEARVERLHLDRSFGAPNNRLS